MELGEQALGTVRWLNFEMGVARETRQAQILKYDQEVRSADFPKPPEAIKRDQGL